MGELLRGARPLAYLVDRSRVLRAVRFNLETALNKIFICVELKYLLQ